MTKYLAELAEGGQKLEHGELDKMPAEPILYILYVECFIFICKYRLSRYNFIT